MEEVDEEERVVMVNIYDAHASNANFKVKPSTTAGEICKIILSKRDILTSESRFFSIVLVISAFNSMKKCDTHCLRTLKPTETLFEVQRTITTKMAVKYGHSDESKLEHADKWYFKDMRTNPIELGATAEICGEYDSDEDEEISQSDLSYLAKSERKGYLLKRSNSDFNLWRRWYCVLMDQLWCVDIAGDVSRAKCVKLSGMIRYREGYKTLDQLQIIIINSSDGKSHFFRAFNLIDQKKWIQDLNIKTRVAAENDSFSMAEVIITDEEDAKNFRLAREVGEVLDQPKSMEAIAFRRAVDLPLAGSSSAATNKDGEDSTRSTSETQTSQDEKIEKNVIKKLTELRLSQNIKSASSSFYSKENNHPEPPFPSLTSPLNSPSKSNIVFVKQNINDPIAAAPLIATIDPITGESTSVTEDDSEPAAVTAGRNVSVVECTPFTHPRACSDVDLSLIQICERVENHNLVHELHRDSRVVAEALLFVIAVQRYREVLRRELYMPLKRQQDAAKNLYFKFIMPQLLLADLSGYPDFSHESMQLGSSVAPDGTVSAKLVAPTSPTRSYFSNRGGSSPNNRNSTNANKRNEYSNRVRGRSQSQLPPGATDSSSAGSETATTWLHWQLDTEVLMRVHETLFRMHTRTVELHHSFVTQDPSQLVKYAAGTSKFRSRERSVSTSTAGAAIAASNAAAQSAQAPTPAAAASFWPWWGSGATTPVAAATSTPTAAPSASQSRKGSDAQAAASAKGTAEIPNGKDSSPVPVVEAASDSSPKASDVKTAPAAAPPAPQSTPSPQIRSKKHAEKHSEDRIEKEKPPSADLFDEVVVALLQKLS